MTNEQKARCEKALMGYVVPVVNEELESLIEYSLKVIHCNEEDYDAKKEAKEVMYRIFEYDSNKTYKVKWFTINKVVEDFIHLCFVIESPDKENPYWEVPDNLNDLAGNEYFSYVWNDTVPWFSELGYTAYDKRYGRVRRVG